MKIYDFKSIKTDIILTEDLILSDVIQDIIKSNDIISSARKKACNQLFKSRVINRKIRSNLRNKMARYFKKMRLRIHESNNVLYEHNVRNTIQWMTEIQDIELIILRDVLQKAHHSLSYALPGLVSSTIDWSQILDAMISKELEKHNITGVIRITQNPALKLNFSFQHSEHKVQVVYDVNCQINKVLIENQHVRITLDPLKQMNILLDLFKVEYLNLIEKG